MQARGGPWASQPPTIHPGQDLRKPPWSRYYNDMSTNLPALSGTVVPQSDVADEHAHKFFNVVRNLLHSSHAFHSESDLDEALNSVNAFERHFLAGPLSRQVSEDDRAPKEDVTQRVPPPTGAVVVPPSAGPAIDYNKLAAAMFELQQQHQQQQQQAAPPVQQEGTSE